MSASTAAKKLVVCGGSGFLGSRICKAAVRRGWDVTSISRSGEPQWKTVTSSPTPPPWAHKVFWERADIFRPAEYVALLKGADYVVHTMGILLEADYKDVISGRESPIAGLKRAFSPAARSANPLERRGPNSTTPEFKPPTSGRQLTYEMMNRDSAILLAKEAAREHVAAFGYISAAAGAPVLPGRYITTKREAEHVIVAEFPEMRGVFFRPPFMYDSSRPFTLPIAAAATALDTVIGPFKGKLGGLDTLLGAAALRPLKVDLVAEAVVEGLADEHVKGVVEDVRDFNELESRSLAKAPNFS
ncbi:hypothetical protein B0T17DRAFT_490125 [Bombardia bombarda]|uniref:NAD-dependent epimerase/dehydratase domain-containing protein n=1 Tax=Bombardia bombarda TaxID=252184 RepID=A0AA39XB74_9PEZI|nr:hypothetical protein B0T17DRAFT_490125 [Bombardia bombarda]